MNSLDSYSYRLIGKLTAFYSKRRNKFHQKLVEKLVRVHTNLVVRESLYDDLHHLLPGDIELIIEPDRDTFF